MESFLVEAKNRPAVLIQQINSNVFKSPEDIQFNYQLIYEHVQNKNVFIPRLVKTIRGELFWKDEEDKYWRAFEYVANSFSINMVGNVEEAKAVAKCFGNFASVFKDFPVQKLKTIIADFHNLSFRYQEFVRAIQTTKFKVIDELKGFCLENSVGLTNEKFISVVAYQKKMVTFPFDRDGKIKISIKNSANEKKEFMISRVAPLDKISWFKSMGGRIVLIGGVTLFIISLAWFAFKKTGKVT